MVQAILLACLSFAAPADTARVIIVATTDVHGNATAWDYALDRPFQGGLTRAATVVDSLRRLYPEQVVLVDAGDLLQGSPFAAFLAHEPRSPHPIVAAMNAMGYDAATPGNHDFDFGAPCCERRRRDEVQECDRESVDRPSGHAALPLACRDTPRTHPGCGRRLHHARSDALGPGTTCRKGPCRPDRRLGPGRRAKHATRCRFLRRGHSQRAFRTLDL
jgi:hypothetical protein